MHLRYAISQQCQVPVIVEQSGLDAGDVLGQPFAVAERDHQVLPAMQQQDRDSDAGEIESPRPDRAVVLPQSRAASRHSVLLGGHQVLSQLTLRDGRIWLTRSPSRLNLRRGVTGLNIITAVSAQAGTSTSPG